MALPAPISSLAHQAGRVAQSAGTTVAIYVAIALVALVGTGFLVAAAFIWLAVQTDPLIASLILAGVFLGIAGICLGVLRAKQERAKLERRQSAANTALMASSISIADAGLRIVSRAKGPMFWPAAATLFAAWYLTRNKNGDD